jgi:cytidylate kinase
MSAITVSRQVGSRGDDLAALIARQLGWRWVSRDLINQAALAAGVPQVALAEVDELGLFGIRPSAREWRAYQAQVERIICELANAGAVVIVGRGGQVVLRQRPEVLHVRVVAPLQTQLAWLREERRLAEDAARSCLETINRARARYLRRCYGVDVNDPSLYHLVVNTGMVELDQAATLIVRAWRDRRGA